jgi:hypothetical protein
MHPETGGVVEVQATMITLRLHLIIHLFLLEVETRVKVTMAVLVMIAETGLLGLILRVGAAAQVRLVAVEPLLVLAPGEQVYLTVSVVRPYSTRVVVGVVRRMFRRVLVEAAEEGREEEVATQELPVRLTLAVGAVVVGSLTVLRLAMSPAVPAAPAS